MKFVKSKYRKKVLILLFLSFGMILTNLSLSLFNSPFLNNNSEEGNIIDFDDQNLLPKTSDSLPSSNGVGNEVNISLHQSYLNSSFNIIVNTSTVNGNNFTLPCPTDTTFNSSYTNITVEDIVAPNRSIIIESATSGGAWDNLYTNRIAASFSVPTSCFLENVSVYIWNAVTTNGQVEIQLYNSSWDSANSRSKPDGELGPNLDVLTIDDFTGWLNFTNLHGFLNVSKTQNNTFFVVLDDDADNTNWYYIADGVDNSDCYYESGLNNWIIWETGPQTVDFTLKTGISPLNHTPNPEDIGLKINNTKVNGYANINGTGYWESLNAKGSTSGELKFNVSADWWDVTCNISQVQINYTKTDLKADSSFEVLGNGQNVIWNVTKSGGLNYFGTDFNDYRINFTISANWHDSSIKVFNGSDEWSINKKLLGNGYREVEVPNAINGTFWFLNATSSNLLENIKKYVGTSSIADAFNYTDLVHFNGTFSSSINNGSINLSVYNPLTLNDQLNHTFVNSSFGSGTEIYFGDWDISDTVDKYGKFRILTQWNNGTDAGFFRDNMTIFAETNLLIDQPSQNTTFNSSTIFNTTITYNDIGQSLDISDGDIYYKINAGTYSSVNESVKYIGSGQYNITFDCNNTEFNYGSNTITIRANNTYYNNQTETLNIIILGETELDGSILKDSFDSMETFNVSLYFNDTVKDSGIFGAIRDIYVNSTPYVPISNHDYGDGNYNITINCDDAPFDDQGYGDFNLGINFEKSDYHNQSTNFTISITGETSLNTTKFPDPSIGYYNSDEMFNITTYFKDIGRNEGINGGEAKIYVKEVSAGSYQEYTPVILDPFGVGYYNFTVNCSDPIFNPYGKYDIKINITKSHYYTAEDELLGEIVIGNTTLTILDPTGPVSYVEDEIFNIIIEYEDHTNSTGIAGADITYTINGTDYRSDAFDNSDGTYDITVDVGDTDFVNNYGYVDIIIRANKSNYINLTRTLTFERQILTQITPFNNLSLVEVMKGVNVTYTFNYSDTSGNPIVEYDNFQNTSLLNGFQYHLWNNGSGNYTLKINTSNVEVIVDPYTLNFSISVFGNQSQEIFFTILVTIKQTNIEIESWNDNADFARSTWTTVSIDFYFNDTTNIAAIDGLLDSNIIIKDYYAGTTWQPGFELFNRAGPGNYKLNISTIGKNSGLYTLQLNISKYPDFNWSLAYIEFYLRGNYTQLNLISYSYSDPEIVLTPTGLGYNFTIFEGSDTTIVLNLTDLEYGNNIVLGVANSYTATYLNLVTSSNGALSNSFLFTSPNHVGTLITSLSALTPGRYLINLTLSQTNYEDASFSFNLTVIARYQTNLSVVFKPTAVDAGDSFRIVVQAEYFNGIGWVPLQSAYITMTPIFNGVPSSEVQTKSTNSTGQLFFDVTIRSDARTMNITLELSVEYDHLGDSMVIFEISVIPPPPNGFSFEDLLPFIIMIGAALVVVGGSVGVYRGVIVPKKREKQRILTEVKTIFDDAINLEHILVLYKGTGTCIFFKSYGSEQIDPELIGGFLSAVSSFGKEMATQEALNEISYGDKMLLLADGALIRVALVLGKNASLILRRHLKEFIGIFEKTFNDILPKWRGQLNHFRNAGTIVDEILNTSIILPHQISYDFSNIKDLKKPHSKEVLKIAQRCCEEAEREFFFVATLLKEVADRTNKDTAEIFMGIKELRDKKILIPIEISAIGEQPVSQQEINLINQKVTSLPNLTNEEKQKLVNDLAQLGPIEREAYLSSLTKQQEIVTAPIKTTIGDLSVENQKAAKKGIKELLKRAKIAQSKKAYIKAVEIYQGAAILASNWELTTELLKIQETIRKTRIEDLKIKKTNLENEAKSAVKAKKYLEAATKYKYASKMASEIFKLGVTEMTKEVKRLTNKAKEYEKMK